MADYTSNKGGTTAPRPFADRVGTPVVVPWSFTLPAATAFANGDTVAAVWLPKGHVPVPTQCYLSFEELDTNVSPTGTFDMGLDGATDALFDGVAMGGSAASYRIQANNLAADALAVDHENDRLFTLRVVTAVATGATAKTVYGVFTYVAADE